MSKLIKLVLSNTASDIRAEDISGFSAGTKQGSGYVYILGVGSLITEGFEKSRNEWLEYIRDQNVPGSQTFEFKDEDDQLIFVRLNDVKTIRQHGTRGRVHMNDHVAITSSESYHDLTDRFRTALKA